MNDEMPGASEEDFPPEAQKDKPKADARQPRKGNGAHTPDDELLPAEFSDDALAVEWIARYGENWRYVLQWDRWYQWTGAHWERNTKALYFEHARQLTREALTWPKALSLPDAQKRRINNATTAAQMIRFIRSDPAIAEGADIWDSDPLLLGIPGGTIDLRLCKAIEPERAHYITKRTSVAPAGGKPERWLAFLEQVTGGDNDLVSYLHRFSGYCLTGETKEHALAFLYGTGANGKTTFVETLLFILGDYGLTTGMETLSESKSERHPAEIARLHGARMVSAEETSTGSRWNEGRIKRLTGGGKISARMLYENEFEFTPQCKFLLAGNHRPAFQADEAMKRRIHLVPFTITIPEQDRDRELSATLRAEAPQILQWMIEGCAAWKDYGLAPGERIREATAKYVDNNDTIGAWVSERIEVDMRVIHASGKALFTDFSKWLETQQERPWSKRKFTDAMIDRGFEQHKTSNDRGFAGIGLKFDPDAPPAE